VDYDPAWPEEYARLKGDLAGRSAADRATYTEEKTEFIRRVTHLAMGSPATGP
jgi:GrpB-like predicted nucleotidyltransferase (UPF0157 family)